MSVKCWKEHNRSQHVANVYRRGNTMMNEGCLRIQVMTQRVK